MKRDRVSFFTIQVFFREKIEFRGVTIPLIVGNLVSFFYRKEEMVKILRCLLKAGGITVSVENFEDFCVPKRYILLDRLYQLMKY